MLPQKISNNEIMENSKTDLWFIAILRLTQGKKLLKFCKKLFCVNKGKASTLKK